MIASAAPLFQGFCRESVELAFDCTLGHNVAVKRKARTCSGTHRISTTLTLVVCLAFLACGTDGSGEPIAAPDSTPDLSAEEGQASCQAIDYLPHTVLNVPAANDIEGLPDLADPHVLKVGSTWYLYATNNKVDLQVWLSEDLQEWTAGGTVWSPIPGTWNAEGQAWAPHVQQADEGFFLYYTAAMMIGVAYSDSPTGPFEELLEHPLAGGGYGGVGDGVFEHRGTDRSDLDFEEFTIDAFVLAAADGSLTFYATAYTPLSIIRATPMVDYITLKDVSPEVVMEPDAGTWELFGMEGPWVIEHGGSYHMMYSGNFAETANYALGVAVGPTPFGPFVKRDDNPFLHKNEEAQFWGPGHHSVSAGACDDLLMFYHTKVTSENGFDRRVRYVPVSFNDAGSLQLDSPQP